MIKHSKVTAIYGTGGIMMGAISKDQEGYAEVHLQQVEEGEIGSKQRDNHRETLEELKPDIVLRFNKPESVDALIQQLEIVKEHLKL